MADAADEPWESRREPASRSAGPPPGPRAVGVAPGDLVVNPRRWPLLLALSGGALLSTATTVGISPFLLDIGRDLGADLAATGNLVAVQSVAWGVASVFAGAASDRFGRRPLLVLGLLCLLASEVAVARAATYPAMAAWRAFGGVGGGAFMGTAFATASDHFPAAERGRALGWVVTGQSLSLVLGQPAMTLAGAVGGWRGAVDAHALSLLLGVVATWVVVPAGRTLATAGGALPARALARLLGWRVLALLSAGAMERVCYAAVAVFLPTFLLTSYPVTPAELAAGLGLVAVGNLLGNLLGGQVGDRVRPRQRVAAASLLAAGLLALPALGWAPGLAVSAGLGFAFTLANAFGRPALLAVLSEVSSEARGAVLGLNISFASIGWLSATALGGVLVGVGGFGALGALMLALGLTGAVLAVLSGLPAPPRARRAPPGRA